MSLAPLYRAATQHRGNVSKAKAADIVERLYLTYPDAVEDLAKLQAFFLPVARSKKPASPFAWVAQAAARRGTRPYLAFVLADGSRIWATDGHRLHSVPDTREPGLYDPACGVRCWGLNVSEAGHPGTFPECWRVVPVADASACVEYAEVVALPPTKAIKDRATIDGQPFQFGYWAEATQLCTRWVREGEATPTSSAKLKLTGPEGELAVVMGMRL